MSISEPAASALRACRGLSGLRIARVVYREIKYETNTPAYRETDHHSLDYGLELHLESGEVVSYTWKWPPCYYLGITSGDLSLELSGEHAIWDVTNEQEWSTLIGREILGACLDWFQDAETEGDYPFTAKLNIASGSSVYFTLGVADQGDDQLAVFFSDGAARAHGRFIDASGPRRLPL